MVEVDEFDLTATADSARRGPGTGAPRWTTDAWMWVWVALALVLVGVGTARPPPPLMTVGVLAGDLTQPPNEVWATPLPPQLADDLVLQEGPQHFPGSVQSNTGETRVVVVSTPVGVAGFDAEGGSPLWEHSISGATCHVTAAVTCVHAAGKWRATISLIDPATGTRTVYEVPGAMRATALTSSDDVLRIAVSGRVAMPGPDGAATWVRLLDIDGTALWRVGISGGVGALSLLSAGDHVYVGNVAPSVVDVTTGAVIAHPERVRPGSEGIVEILDGAGEVTFVLPDGEELRSGEDVADAWLSRGDDQGRLPGAPWPVRLVATEGGTGAIDVEARETLWVRPGAMLMGTVVDGGLVGIVDNALVRWEW